MKNIQVIDGAVNCVYDVFAASDDDHSVLFPDGTDVAFAEDFESRADVDQVEAALERLRLNRLPKALAMGIHGTLFYQLPEKREYRHRPRCGSQHKQVNGCVATHRCVRRPTSR
jgi:hypothetical protein